MTEGVAAALLMFTCHADDPRALAEAALVHGEPRVSAATVHDRSGALVLTIEHPDGLRFIYSPEAGDAVCSIRLGPAPVVAGME